MNLSKLLKSIWVLSLLSISHFLIGQQNKDEKLGIDIEELVLSSMEDGDIPGLSLVIIQGDSQLIKTYGFSDVEQEISVTAQTLFEIGSCSKAFTALTITQLEHDQLLDLDAYVSDFLPWFKQSFEGEQVDITIRQLLHHTSGIPWNTISKIPESSSIDALEQTVRKLINQELDHFPGEEYQYATINYDVLALIIEKVTNQTFENYINETILDSLQLEFTSVGEPRLESLMSTGYKIGFFSAYKYEAPRFYGNNAAGYFISNAIDMAVWLNFQLGMGDSNLYHLAKATHQRDETVAIHGMRSYARGWEVSLDGTGTIFHAGLNPNYSSFIAFRPDIKLGVALLSNSNSLYVASIGDRIMKILGNEKIEDEPEPGDQGDKKFSIISIILIIYCLIVFGYLSWIFIQASKGKRKCERITISMISKFLKTLLLMVPILLAVYLIPQALADFNWHSIMVWMPFSFELLVKLGLLSIGLTYSTYIASLLFPEPEIYKRRAPQILLMSIISGLANVAIIIMVTSSMEGDKRLLYLVFYYSIFLTLYLFGRRFVQKSLVKFTRGLVYDLRIQLIQKIFSTSYQNFEQIDRGRVYTALNDDVNTIGHSTNTIVTLITNIITTLGAFIFLAAIASWATLLTILIILTLSTIYYFVTQSTNKYYEEARDSRDVFMGLINGMIDGFKEISLHKNKKLAYKQDVADSALEFREKVSIADIKFVDAFMVGESLLVILLGAVAIGMSIIFPNIGFYTIMSFVIILLYLIGPINVILGSVPALMQLKVAWKRVNNFIKEIPATLDLESPPVKSIKTIESFEAKGIKFQYDNSDSDREFGIGPIDLEVKKGEILFIIGGNGSGKTTFAKLLTGLYEADEGEFMINDQPLATGELGEYYSTVFSPSYLFKKLYDINTGNKNSEIDQYLKLLDLEEKVAIENNAFTTIKLSNGQRKRLALLQCYLEDSPIYLFDEWAADQDPSYRKFFYRTLLPEMKKAGKIVIAITHDDHYFDVADKVLKMNNGKLVAHSNIFI